MSGSGAFSDARRMVVLVVDRDAASAGMIGRFLAERAEVASEGCADPERAVEAAAASGAGVALFAIAAETDLPLLRRLSDVGLPVVALARRASAALRERAFAAGAADCFAELPEPTELLARLRALGRAVLAERERDEARRQLALLRRRLEEGDQDLESGVASRRRLDAFLDGEWRRARRNGSHLSLVLLEPSLVQAGGPGGNGSGERPVVRLAVALKGALRRGGDLLASCGDGRFAAVLPEVGSAGAATVARALAQAAAGVASDGRFRLGTATLRPQESPTCGPQSLLEQAAAALAEAGR
jgi:two-component system chemotaxis family response regulator WspR